MASFDVLQWFRESQRILLELRAWVTYMLVVKPRVENPRFNAVRCLPVRGIITEKVLLAETMFRVGVPVWLVREPYTISDSTTVLIPVRPTPVSKYLSNKLFMIEGNKYRRAPPWEDGLSLDAMMVGFSEQLFRFSLSSQPLVSAKVALGAEDRLEAAKAEGAAMEATATQHGPGTSSGSAPHPAVGRAQKTGSDRLAKAEPKPAWLTAECAFLAAVIARDPALAVAHPHRPQLYHLPPIHLFFNEGSTQGGRIHNWLRIRPWCIAQTVRPPQGGRVVLTAGQWRVALEGRYYRIDIPADRDIRPQSSSVDIGKLPPPPPKTGTATGPQRAPDRRTQRRAADRVDVNVRFGVHGGFEPYREELQPLWGSRGLARAQADLDTRVWMEVTWELSCMNFRLELMALDRIMDPAAYSEESGWGTAREEEVMLIWEGDGKVRPMWDRRAVVCGIESLADGRRLGAFTRWARVLNSWPAANGKLPQTPEGTTQDLFEAHIARFYCFQFYSVSGRLPSFPLVAPSSLSRHYQ
ncbi:hypothetical protein FA95DRAFT_1612691 [Auriscalpium vulgare]|uniref:Uncharacterized protein n=1 Tax=Auriscalpium vulgare TaxID=40419 RepID=A0ACB8R5L4_9AGAM|nr:hypothetical protein FA95DRAFT_1612691 [Auriscalpium vulgare]